MLVNLWVRDNSTGEVHQVGTNHHDSLAMFEDEQGVLSAEYVNMQNGCGTFGGRIYFRSRT